MRAFHAVVLVVALLPPGIGQAAGIDWPQKRAALGHEDKFRILVDKVLCRSNNWVMTEAHVREIKEAGFNVVVPRMGGTDMNEVRRVADLAARQGIFYMPWMRGTLDTKTGTRLVWETGVTQDLYSPNADELWDWMTGVILDHARIGRENPAVVGSFLDFENYAKGKVKNCYFLSFDDKILAEFARARGLTIPALEPAQRKAWLVDHGSYEAFEKFQLDSWRRRCGELRRKVDAINPRHQLIVYPLGTLFLEEAIYSQWSTQQAPLVIADPSTYGRKRDLPHARALAANRDALLQNLRRAQGHHVPLFYTGGIDPAVKGADPEFCGANALMMAEATDGYWVFYEGPDYTDTHPHYFQWFRWANRAILDGKLQLWKQPRQEPDPALADERRVVERFCGLAVQPYTSDPVPDDARKATFRTRGRSYCGVWLSAGEVLNVRAEIQKIGGSDGPCELRLFGPDQRMRMSKEVESGATGQFTCAADQTGLHVLTTDSGRDAASLQIANPYAGLLASEPVNLIGTQPTGSFLPDEGGRSRRVTVSSPSPGETVRLTVLDSSGQELATVDTTRSPTAEARFDLPASAHGKPLSLRLEKAAQGTLEDMTVRFTAGCGDFLATHPARLLTHAR